MIVKVSRNFLTRDSNSKLIFDTGNIITSLTGNASFSNPSPTIVAITTARTAFITAAENASHRDTKMVALRDAARIQLVALFRQLASWVEGKANSDLAVLLSSGFPAQKTQHEPVGELPAPNSPTLRNGVIGGSIVARTPKVNGAYTYNWRAALASAPTVDVQTPQTTAARRTFPGLIPGLIYIIQLNAVGTAGESNWSGISSLMVI